MAPCDEISFTKSSSKTQEIYGMHSASITNSVYLQLVTKRRAKRPPFFAVHHTPWVRKLFVGRVRGRVAPCSRAVLRVTYLVCLLTVFVHTHASFQVFLNVNMLVYVGGICIGSTAAFVGGSYMSAFLPGVNPCEKDTSVAHFLAYTSETSF